MANKKFVYYAIVRRIHDGDTIFVDLDLGMGIWNRGDNPNEGMAIRLYGINAPELSTQDGKVALTYLQTLIKPGDEVRLESIEWHEFDKYGRLLAVVYQGDSNINDMMINNGHAVSYFP
jgi:endonuclease YncB( thermonuclease family)